MADVMYVKVYPRHPDGMSGQLAYYPVTSMVVVEDKIVLRGYWYGKRKRQQTLKLADFSVEAEATTWTGPLSGNGI